MRQFLRQLLCASGLLAALPALAVDDGTKEAPPADESEGSVSYSAGGLIRSDVDNLRLNSNSQLVIDNGVSLVGTVGFRIPTFPAFGIELEVAATVIPGQISREDCRTIPGTPGGVLGGGTEDSTSCDPPSDQGDFGVQSISVYGVFRSPGKFYGMAKYGLGYVASNIDGYPVERSVKPYGLGLGYRWNPRKLSGVELYYAKIGESVSYQGLSFSYGFGGRD